MKKILSLAIVLLQIASASAADSDTLTVRIKGMRCDECAHKVMTALDSDDGVGDIQFNLERRTATICYDPAKTCADSIYACLDATKRYKASPYSADEVILRGIGFRIDDMFCQNCINRIVKRLEPMEGVDSLAPHLDKQYVFIRYDANRTAKDSICAAINKLGFTPVNYYTSDKIGYAYYNIPAEAATQETVDALYAIEAVEDVNVNARRKSVAVTYFTKDMTAEQLLDKVRSAGIAAVVPPPHVCKEKQE